MKPAKDIRREVKDRLVVNYPGYFCDGQTVGVLGRWRSDKLGMAMVHIVAKQNGKEIEVGLPEEKFVSVEEAQARKSVA